MPYRAPVSDYRFLMENVVGFAQVTATARFAEATPDMADAILTEAAKMCEEVLYPLNRSGDLHPAHLDNGIVRTAPGFAGGYKAIAEGGLDRHVGQPRSGRHGPADDADHHGQRNDGKRVFISPVKSADDPGPDRGAGASRL